MILIVLDTVKACGILSMERINDLKTLQYKTIFTRMSNFLLPIELSRLKSKTQ